MLCAASSNASPAPLLTMYSTEKASLITSS